jgi:uncharacterized alpha-E superfamily protein
LPRLIDERDIPTVLDAIKRETALIKELDLRHAIAQRDFRFLAGRHLCRASRQHRAHSRCQILRSLPSISWVGSTLDNSQWESILRSVSAHRSYRWVYDAQYKPTNIADYLILNGRMPRSLAFSYRMIQEHPVFWRATMESGTTATDARPQSRQVESRLDQEIFDTGLHEFLSSFIRDNNRLSDEIAANYRFI